MKFSAFPTATKYRKWRSCIASRLRRKSSKPARAARLWSTDTVPRDVVLQVIRQLMCRLIKLHVIGARHNHHDPLQFGVSRRLASESVAAFSVRRRTNEQTGTTGQPQQSESRKSTRQEQRCIRRALSFAEKSNAALGLSPVGRLLIWLSVCGVFP